LRSYRPAKWQEPVIEFLLDRGAAGIFARPGLRKTATMLCALQILFQEKMIKRVLVLATKRICYHVWPEQIDEWNFPLTCTVVHRRKKEEKILEDTQIHITTYDTFQWMLPRILSGSIKYDVLIIDESSKIKNRNSARFKAISKAMNYFKRRYILTGSPRPNHLIDIWSQIYVLDAGHSLSPYITHFRAEYFQQVFVPGLGRRPLWVPKPSAEKRIYKKLKPYIYSVDEKNVKVPKRNVIPIKIELPPKARKLYNELEKEMIAEFEKSTITAFNAGVLTHKLRQIANGGIYPSGEKGKGKLVHMEKAEAVKEIVDEMGGSPVLIGYEFKHDLERLLKVLGKNTPVIRGKTTEKQAAKIIEDWNKGNLEVMLAQLQSISHGLNLQKSGNTVIIHSLIWNQDNYDQFIRRVQRPGQRSGSVNVFHITAINTTDQAITASLKKKTSGQESMMLALQQYITKAKQRN